MPRKIYLSPPHMGDAEVQYVQEAFATNWIAPLGPNVDAFEKSVCDYVGVRHGLALSSGTAAIHLGLRYLGVGPGDYVFCSSLTFAGSCNPIMYQYAQPVFIDAEPESWNMSPKALERAFHWAKKEDKMPKAVIIVDLYGQSADYDALLPLCKHYGVPVIEDAAEALGASYRGKMCGSLAYMGIFSFNGNKIVTTSGGGMVVSDDEEAIKKMRYWATQAREPELHYEHLDYGYNYQMSNVCAGIGRGQMQVLPSRIQAKQQIFSRYVVAFAESAFAIMPIAPFGESNYWLTCGTLAPKCHTTPAAVIRRLLSEGIEARPVWKPMHFQPVFASAPSFAHKEGETPIGTDLFNRGICLPSGSALTMDEQERVIEIVLSAIA